MIRQLHEWNSNVSFGLGCALNAVLFWLVAKRTPKEMRVYSHILVQTVVTDTLFACANLAVQPIFFTQGNVSGMFINNEWVRSAAALPTPRVVVVSLWFCVLFVVIIGLAAQFVFRYFVLIRGDSTLALRYYLCTLVTLLCTALANCSLPLLSLLHRSDTPCIDAKTADLLSLLNASSATPIDFVIDLKDPILATSLTISSLTFVACYAIIIFCRRRMVKHVTTHTFGSGMEHKRAVELNQQLTRNLTTLAVIPFLIVSTCAICILFIVVDSSAASSSSSPQSSVGYIDYVQVLLFAVMHWPPVLNPLVTMCTVRPYWQAVGAVLERVTRRSNSSSAVTELNRSAYTNRNNLY